ncbi:MAG: helix-turn-helix transcriptional regulator [Pseudomonadota bacterium]
MANEIDAHIGMRLRQRRWLLGLTQQQLGDRVGIKFQQVQKYETGQNRISASRLWELARAVEVRIAYFFDGLGHEVEGFSESEPSFESQGDLLADREAAELVRAYYATPEPQRRRLYELVKAMGDIQDVEPIAEKPAQTNGESNAVNHS